jgi:hypothetical protein
MDAYTANALGSNWNHIWAYLATESAASARLLAHGGVEQLLNNTHPGMRWRGGVLEIDHGNGDSAHLRLDGRGLVLVRLCSAAGSPPTSASPTPTGQR